METGFLDRVVGAQKYVVFAPKDVQPPYPAVLFLHGRGESGTDGLRQTAIGLGQAIRFERDKWPFLVVFPQKPSYEDRWRDRISELDEVLKAVEEEFAIHPTRRYITGLSQGGYGTFSVATSLHWQFAAAAPVCGWMDDEADIVGLAAMPLWAFHGEADDTVLPQKSEAALASLRDAGGNPMLTLYPDVGHNSWDKAYTDGLPYWFLSFG